MHRDSIDLKYSSSKHKQINLKLSLRRKIIFCTQHTDDDKLKPHSMAYGNRFLRLGRTVAMSSKMLVVVTRFFGIFDAVVIDRKSYEWDLGYVTLRWVSVVYKVFTVKSHFNC